MTIEEDIGYCCYWQQLLKLLTAVVVESEGLWHVVLECCGDSLYILTAAADVSYNNPVGWSRT